MIFELIHVILAQTLAAVSGIVAQNFFGDIPKKNKDNRFCGEFHWIILLHIVAPWCHMVTCNWINILPDSTKPLPEPILTCHHWGPVTFIWGKFRKRYHGHQNLLENFLFKISINRSIMDSYKVSLGHIFKKWPKLQTRSSEITSWDEHGMWFMGVGFVCNICPEAII